MHQDDQDALNRIRALIEKIGENPKSGFNRINSIPPVKNTEEIFEILPNDKSQPYDTYEIIERIVDKLNLDLYTEVIDWEEMKDLQLSFFKSGVSIILLIGLTFFEEDSYHNQ